MRIFYLLVFILLLSCGKDESTTTTVVQASNSCYDFIDGKYGIESGDGTFAIHLTITNPNYIYVFVNRTNDTYYAENGLFVKSCNEVTFIPIASDPADCGATNTLYTLSMRNGQEYLEEFPLYPTDMGNVNFLTTYMISNNRACEI